jgi:hypothetical protein
MDRRETRSARLKKYASVYREYIRNKSKSPEPKKHRHTTRVKGTNVRETTSKETNVKDVKAKETNVKDVKAKETNVKEVKAKETNVKDATPEEKKRTKEEKVKDSGRGRKKLTEYQKFVKEESKKEKYNSLKPEERLAKIAKSWKKKQLKKTELIKKNV